MYWSAVAAILLFSRVAIINTIRRSMILNPVGYGEKCKGNSLWSNPGLAC